MNRTASTLKALSVAAVVAVLVSAPAWAQIVRNAVQRLDADQIRSALFGIDMQGHSPSYGFSWRECIDPEGRTLYETPDGVQTGRLDVDDLLGLACFSYADDDYSTESCYSVSRTRSGFVFEGQFGAVFITTRVETGVRSCEPDDDLIG